jgi:uncharacterized protein YecE (DUF72 family)
VRVAVGGCDSWLTEDVYALPSAYNVALCSADFGDKTTPLRWTAGHGYLRLRDEGYGPADLAKWADRVVAQASAWQETFVFFKHDEEGKGPEFARAFVEALGLG